MVSDAIVTAVLPDGSYYVEDADRTCGIRVCGGPIIPSPGDRVRVAGTITAQTGEARVDGAACAVSGTGSLGPLGMPNKMLGGGPFDIQPGITSRAGVNNIGLLVRIWGNVTAAGRGWFYLDDGSGVKDGSGNVGIYVEAEGEDVPSVGAYVCVTGISSPRSIPGQRGQHAAGDKRVERGGIVPQNGKPV